MPRYRCWAILLGCGLLMMWPQAARVSAAAVAVRVIARAANGLPLGPHRVIMAEPLNIPDHFTRHKLTFRAYYPAEPGRFPVLIFSHGLGGSRSAFSDLNTFLASHGYVVLAPDHPDAHIFYDLLKSGQFKGKLGLRESVIQQGLAATKKKLRGRSPAMARIVEIKELLAALPAIQKKLPRFTGQFDMRRIGMAGHSFGAFTTEVMAGVLVPARGRWPGLADRRIKAVEIISGGGGRKMLRVNRRAGAPGDKPMLVITGTRDDPPSGQGYRWREEPFTKSPPGHKFLLLINGATHNSYQFNSRILRMDPHHPDAASAKKIAAEVERASAAFWNDIFKHNGKEARYLKHGPWPAGMIIEHH